jgi:flagellar biosynthesis chaperone FliJ
MLIYYLKTELDEEVKGKLYLEELHRVMEKEKTELANKVAELTKEKEDADDDLYEFTERREALEKEIATVSIIRCRSFAM